MAYYTKFSCGIWATMVYTAFSLLLSFILSMHFLCHFHGFSQGRRWFRLGLRGGFLPRLVLPGMKRFSRSRMNSRKECAYAICGITADKYGDISKFFHLNPSFAWTGRLHMQPGEPVLGLARSISKIAAAVLMIFRKVINIRGS